MKGVKEKQFLFTDHLFRFIYYDNLIDLDTIDNRNEENILQWSQKKAQVEETFKFIILKA